MSNAMDRKTGKVGAAAVAVSVVVVVVAVLASRGASRSSADTAGSAAKAVGAPAPTVPGTAPASTGATPTTAPVDGAPTTAVSDAPAASAPDGAPPAQAPPGNAADAPPVTVPRAPKELPVNATVSGTSGLADGSKVSIHVTPQPGSQAFAFEAFLCRADATFTVDADIRATQTGKCLPEPLSASSDNRTEVVGQAPYQSLDGTFRVGVGSKTFKTQSGQTVTVTCGPGSPCQLVLKLQYPNGYGFKAIPLTY